jgi:glyoxylase-like metal-dependent hydrolase (beta-lactamase superfamily II)
MWQELDDGVFLLRYNYLTQNIGVVIGSDGLVVIDTRSNPEQAAELRGDIRRLSDLPVRWVVNTHYHWDHSFGNSVFTESQLWGQVRCRQALVDRGEEMLAELEAWMPADEFLPMRSVVIVPPDHTFESEATLVLGDRSVTLHYLGRGHTDSDIVVHAGDVTFAGDLLEEGSPPYVEDSFPADWVETLARLSKEARGSIVPGHGNVMGPAQIEQSRAEMAWIVERALAGDTDFAASPYREEVTRVVVARAMLESQSHGRTLGSGVAHGPATT